MPLWFLPPYVGSYDPKAHHKDTNTQIQRSRRCEFGGWIAPISTDCAWILFINSRSLACIRGFQFFFLTANCANKRKLRHYDFCRLTAAATIRRFTTKALRHKYDVAANVSWWMNRTYLYRLCLHSFHKFAFISVHSWFPIFFLTANYANKR